MSLASLLILAAAVTDGAQQCDIRVGELVPTAAVARDVAAAIIRSRQNAERRSRYVLHVEPDGASGWIVFQALPELPGEANGEVTVRTGGGGLGMRIDRCNAAISNVVYQR